MWNLYVVRHPIGEFIGVALNQEEAREHWGQRAEITLLQDYDDVVRHLVNMRAEGKHERVFIAV